MNKMGVNGIKINCWVVINCEISLYRLQSRLYFLYFHSCNKVGIGTNLNFFRINFDPILPAQWQHSVIHTSVRCWQLWSGGQWSHTGGRTFVKLIPAVEKKHECINRQFKLWEFYTFCWKQHIFSLIKFSFNVFFFKETS